VDRGDDGPARGAAELQASAVSSSS